MKIALLTHGTRGDVQPFVALALALMDRGHDVTLGTPVNLVSFVEKCGVRAVEIAVDSQAFLESKEGRAWLSSGNVTAFMKELGGVMKRHREELFADELEVCEGADVIVSGILTEDYVSAIAEARGLPMLCVHFNPMRPNELYANALVTSRSLPRFLNRMTGVLAEKAWWAAYRDDVNAFRVKLGLPTTKTPTPVRFLAQGVEMLHAFSPTLAPAPPSYERMPVLGAIQFPDAARARLGENVRDPDLARWLAAGTPPVFFGLGSMPVEDPAAMLRTVHHLTKALGVRAVVGAGWSRFEAAAGHHDEVRIVGACDHGWLLPQCRAAVHHGGAGTTHAAALAGLPSVVSSVFADQPFWGARVEKLGVGVHLPYKQLNEASLEKALRRVLDPAMKAAAEQLAAAIRAEPDATHAIVERVEAMGRSRAASSGGGKHAAAGASR